jgi:hypothetical protein
VFAKIQAVNLNGSSKKGMTLVVETPKIGLNASAAQADSEPFLELSAVCYPLYSSGRRSGAAWEAKRTLTIHLTGSEVHELLRKAATAGMLPGMTQLLAAHGSLSECIRRLDIAVPDHAIQ